MPRLYAVGETCCNGVHGANRLASNSLLESLLFAKRAALDIDKKLSDNLRLGRTYALNNDEKYKYSDYKSLLEGYKKLILGSIDKEKING